MRRSGFREATGELACRTAHSIDLAVVSPARRARSTWELVAAELDTPPRTRIDDRVYVASDRELLALVQELPDDIETVVLVGHNPGIEDLAFLLTGESPPMPTSALAVITWTGTWSAAGRDLAALRASGRLPAQ